MKTTEQQHALAPLELMFFFETLGLLLSSGLTVEESLKLMVSDMARERDSLAMTKLLNTLSSVFVLSASMEQTGLFPPYAVNMVRLAERSGNLDRVCGSLADYYEQENRLNAQIKGAVANPFVLVCIIAVVVAFLVNAIMPIFSNIYAQMGVDIAGSPMVRVALVVGSTAMWTVLGILVISALGFLFSRSRPGRRFFAAVAERAPVTRRFNKSLSMARFASTFSLLLTSGDDLPMALSMASTVCPSQGVRGRLEQCHQQILAGDSLADALIYSGLFSPTHTGMIKSGVRSGSTPKVMQRLAEIYEDDSERILVEFMSLVEPLLIGLLSVVIGIVLLCIMLPLIGILSSFG